jgi:chaperone LolA
MKNKIIISLIALWSISNSSYAQSADDILKNVQKKYNSYKSVCSEFKQTFYWELANETQIVNGNMCVKDGTQFRIETNDQDIISDGETIWTINKLNNQIIIKNASANAKNNPFLRLYIKRYQDNYLAEKNKALDDGFSLTLKSRSEDEFYPLIYLHIRKNYTLKKIKQIDINNNSTTYEILSITDNVQLSPEKFRVQNIEDYEAIDLR